MKVAYLQCIGGVSGDMLLGALVDSGLSVDVLNDELAKLEVEGFSVSAERSQRGGVTGTLVTVQEDESAKHHDRMTDFVDIVKASRLPPAVVDQSSRVFERLSEAEAAAHGVEPEQVHLHELGSLDTLVDVVGTAIGLDALRVEALYCSPLPTGSGVVRSQHGPLPAPAPVTSRLLEMANAPVVAPPGNAPDAGEMITPTGTAIVTTLATFEQPTMTVERVGHGLGRRNPSGYPNVVAIRVGEISDLKASELVLLETNVDDMTAEGLAYAQERLLELGARDVWFTPIQMKKNRPATKLSVLVTPVLEPQAVDVILRETTTLGVRSTPVSRYEADREVVEVETSLGAVKVKVKKLEGKPVSVSPEYEDCRRVALSRSMPLNDVIRIVQNEASVRLL